MNDASTFVLLEVLVTINNNVINSDQPVRAVNWPRSAEEYRVMSLPRPSSKLASAQLLLTATGVSFKKGKTLVL